MLDETPDDFLNFDFPLGKPSNINPDSDPEPENLENEDKPDPVSVPQFDFFIWEAFSDETLTAMASVGSVPAKQEIKIREYEHSLIQGLNGLLRDAARGVQ